MKGNTVSPLDQNPPLKLQEIGIQDAISMIIGDSKCNRSGCHGIRKMIHGVQSDTRSREVISESHACYPTEEQIDALLGQVALTEEKIRSLLKENNK